MKDKETGLSDKQKMFCNEYMIDLNATQAAIRAGYSERSAQAISIETLSIPLVQAYIQKLKTKRAERLEITQDMVLRELAKIGFSNIQDYIQEGNQIDDISKLDKDKAAPVESIKVKVTSGGGEGAEWTSKEVQFKLHDKLSALEKIAKHIGFFKEDNDQLNKPIAHTVIFQIKKIGKKEEEK